MAYDTILLVCVIFVAWQPVPLLPDYLPTILSRAVRLAYLILIIYLFFAWFWVRGGQTLGMRAWKIRLVSTRQPGISVTWQESWLRFVGALFSWACLGAGFLWSMFDTERMTWHDRFSNTMLIYHRPDHSTAPVDE